MWRRLACSGSAALAGVWRGSKPERTYKGKRTTHGSVFGCMLLHMGSSVPDGRILSLRILQRRMYRLRRESVMSGHPSWKFGQMIAMPPVRALPVVRLRPQDLESADEQRAWFRTSGSPSLSGQFQVRYCTVSQTDSTVHPVVLGCRRGHETVAGLLCGPLAKSRKRVVLLAVEGQRDAAALLGLCCSPEDLRRRLSGLCSFSAATPQVVP